MKISLYCLAFLMAVSFASCGKTCYCDSQELGLRYVGFPAAETDTVLVYRFRKASNFQPLDTTRLTAGEAVYTVDADTLAISGDTERKRIRSHYDYILHLPSTNRRDTISAIFEPQDQVEGGVNLECDCINRIISYRLSDSTYQVRQPATPKLYIVR